MQHALVTLTLLLLCAQVAASSGLHRAADGAVRASLGVPFRGVVQLGCGDPAKAVDDADTVRQVRWQSSAAGTLLAIRRDPARPLATLPFCAQGEVQVKVAKAPLTAAQAINSGDFAEEWRNLDGLAAAPGDLRLERPHAVLRARRAIAAGEVLHQGNVSLSRAVERGDKVVLHYRDGQVELEVDALALVSAHTGERVSVRPLTSHTAVTAWVTAPGRAEFRGGTP